MNFVTDLVPVPKGSGDPAADANLANFRAALQGDDTAGLPDGMAALAERIDQANAKIDSGAEITRISELMTLAQFGAGSIGSAISTAFDAPGTKPTLESLMTARFLTEVVLSATRLPHLLPGDILRKENLSRDSIAWPVTEPVYRELLERASLALRQASAARDTITAKPLRKLFDREFAANVRQLRKIAGNNPDSASVRLNRFDRIIISLTILLHIRVTP